MDQRLNPGRPGRIMEVALIVGAISFAAGFIGPIMFSDSNLGPLLGIFVTGPVGFLAGALIGVAHSARHGRNRGWGRELHWLAAVWLLSLLYTLAFSMFVTGWISLGLQAAVVATAAYAFYGGELPKEGAVRHYRLPALVTGVLTLLTSAFPPVVPGVGKPKFAIFLDPRFDASRNVPEFNVDGATLALGWLTLAALALTAGYAAHTWADRRQS